MLLEQAANWFYMSAKELAKLITALNLKNDTNK
jgi:hypothetical protein